MPSEDNTCPICGNKNAKKDTPDEVGYKDIDCPRCGTYRTDRASDNLYEKDIKFAEKLSHWICKNEKKDEKLIVDYNIKRKLKDNIELPDAKEQADLLIKFIGDNLDRPHKKFEPNNTEKLANYIGALDIEGLSYVLNHMERVGLLENSLTTKSAAGAAPISNGYVKLTFSGWQYYHELKVEGADYDKAFMAMQFNDDNINKAYNRFKQAVEKTGFKLFNLQEKPKPGLIDNRLRSEIRNSAFLIADLTNDNNGAYWEAGFAEGLEKPVIYLCEEDYFEDEDNGPHFDTNHHFTVIYNHSDLDDACEQLKATIRAELPHKAKMED